MDLADGLEDHVPIGTTKVGGCAETGDGVLFGIGVVDHDVRGIVGLDLSREVLDSELANCLHHVVRDILTVWISIWSCMSWASMASSRDLNHSKEPKSRQIQKK